ncbi:porin [Thauera sp. SDU_THAU2]|uniref:porin n=1 Tax=Thauera sp. SDU_THAU2 TaxID=3136633 RepID=UPI00311F4266
MQKKLIALAIAGLVSAPVFAQSNVTIYGVADAFVGFGKHGDADFRGVGDGGLSGSRLGFRGTEDLGNGLKAVFVLEQGFDIGTGNDQIAGKSNSRQAFVGLGGAFGNISLGRQYAPGYFLNYDSLAGASVGPQSVLSGGAGMTISPTSNARWSNSVAYSGTFSGLTASVIYSTGSDFNGRPGNAGENNLKPSEDDAYGVGLTYANGPLKVGGVYQVVKYDYVGVANADEKQKEWGVGASYDFGVVALSGSYQSADNLQGAKDRDADLWTVGLAVPVGAAGSVHLAYAELEYDRPGRDPEVKSYTLAYTHALSKRTTAYVAYNRTDNDKGAAMGLVGYGSKHGYGPNDANYGGENADLLGIGIRHTF